VDVSFQCQWLPAVLARAPAGGSRPCSGHASFRHVLLHLFWLEAKDWSQTSRDFNICRPSTQVQALFQNPEPQPGALRLTSSTSVLLRNVTCLVWLRGPHTPSSWYQPRTLAAKNTGKC
jgi:hypothetical protein